MKSARARSTAGPHSFITGRIRAGRKVLTAKAKSNPSVVTLFSEMQEKGKKYDEILVALRKMKDCPQHPLRPTNEEFFTVNPSDFTDPDHARIINDLYAEQREGDERPRLYNFPVIFPTSGIDLIFTEQFQAWGSSGIDRWSSPDEKTQDLQCVRRKESGPKNKRTWGARPLQVLRQCEPNDCDVFATGIRSAQGGLIQCRHSAELRFWIPGIHNIGLIALSFSSIYASMQISDMLAAVNGLLGKVHGIHNGQPIFRLYKKHQKISRINPETGLPEKSGQWLIYLGAEIDFLEQLVGPPEDALASALSEAALASAPPEAALPSAPSAPEATLASVPPEATLPSAPSEATLPSAPPEAAVGSLRKRLSELMHRLEWSPDDLMEYLQGNGYSEMDARDAGKLQDICAELEPIADRKDERETP